MCRSRKKAKQQRRALIRAISVTGSLLLVLLLSQTAFAKTTYVITDGDRVITYESFATDPATVLSQAGLALDENDTYTTEAAFGATNLTVRRSQSVTIDYYGETVTAETYGETVDALLDRLNIYPEEGDALSLSPQAETFDGMVISISRIFQQEQTFTSAIPHTTSYCYDDTLAEGEERVVVEGRDGELRRTATVTYVNGLETAREVTDETVALSPVEEVIAIGTAVVPAGVGETPGVVIGDGTITLSTGEVLTYTHTTTVRASAYTHTDAGCDNITSTGTTVRIGTVAVDPRFIPYGTRMFIVSEDGVYEYGISVAEDCGGAIKGDRVDLYFPSYEECRLFGRRDCTVYFLG